MQIPKLVHKHKHHVVVHEKGGHDEKKHIVIHKHEHKHHHKHDHGHKHGHKHEAKHSHKHQAKHSHKHEAKHQHKHEAKHQHKHQAKHSHKHEAKHQHKHEAKHSHKHKHSHKAHGKHEHHHKHSGHHEHKHKHKHTEKHSKKDHGHEKLVVDLLDDHQNLAYSQEVNPNGEYAIAAPYQTEGDYEEYQQLQGEELVDEDDHDNLENYDDFDSPSENIENYDEDVDFLNAKKPTQNYDGYNYNSAIIGEVLKNTYAAQESPVALASNKVVKKLSPDPFNFDLDGQEFSFASKQSSKHRNKKYESMTSGNINNKKTDAWTPITGLENNPAASERVAKVLKLANDASVAASSENTVTVVPDGKDISPSTWETAVLNKKMEVTDTLKVAEFQPAKLNPKTKN